MKSNFIILFLIASIIFASCKKQVVEPILQEQNTPQSIDVTVVFSTANHYNEAIDWYLYQVAESQDTIINFGTVQVPKYLRIYYSDHLQDGTNQNYSRLQMCTEKEYTIGVHDTYKNIYKPSKKVVFHAKDTLSNGIISYQLNY